MDGPRAFLGEVVIDCADVERLGRFYADLLDCELHVRSDEWGWLEPALRGGHPADAGGARLAFQRVPEPKVGKVRQHLDICAPDVEGTAERAVGLGATHLRGPVVDDEGHYVVLLDPEGHELCIVSVG